MHWKALLVIGIFSLVFGLILYLPARWWLRRRLRKAPPDSSDHWRITPLGLVVYGVMVAVMMTGFSLQYLAPHTWAGHFVSTSHGRIVFTAALVVVWSVLEVVLTANGWRTWQQLSAAKLWNTHGGNWNAKRSGFVRVARIRGIPILVHWTFPIGGLFVADFSNVGFPLSLYYCLTYTMLVAIHEAAHVVAAKAFQLQVLSIEIFGFGGLCRIERPRSVHQGTVIYSAGLLAQIALLVTTLGYVALFGTPANALGKALTVTFTGVNIVLLILNLIPYASKDLATDGLVLWRLFSHRFLGKPHPFPPLEVKSLEQAPVFPPDTSLQSMPDLVPPGFVHGIEVLNDRTTPMEFVARVLSHHLELSREEATVKMIEIHNNGGALIPLQTAEHARKVALDITAAAAKLGFSFVCRAVEISRPATDAVGLESPAP